VNRGIYTLCLLAAALVVGCGDGDGTTDSAGSSETAAAAPDPKSADSGGGLPEKGSWGVAFGAESADHGLLIYDLSGHVLYTFERDKGSTSTCYGACAKTWPPALTEGKPRADGEASPGKVGATKRRDGTVQLTYAGHPLYRYARDRSSELNGNDVESFGGEWYAIRPNGEKL
jgi:predicted lipoprotein with Yx(FWY)xxD motif